MIKPIPHPKSINYIKGRYLTVNHISLGKNRLSKNAVDDFLSFCNMPDGESNILFFDNDGLEEEEYIIEINDNISITASTAKGELYALQTLKQIIFSSGNKLECCVIKDKPRYKLRGFMLDVGRYFFSVDDVKKIIHRMAFHKLNLLHLHLTEDQGWRIEIERYPLLTEKGSYRSKTNFNRRPHGGFYTKEQIKEIVAYAHDFGIMVMPEFDIPGHSRAAIACYKDLTCFPRELKVADHWGVKHDVLCVGKDSTIEFVKNVIDELCELFPDRYFHIGGDEVPKHRWDLCPDCQAKIRKLGLNSSDELQVWFMNEINRYLTTKGKQVFMWSWDLKNQELIDESLGFTKCGELDTGNQPFIDTDTSSCYIDLAYGYISLKDSAEHKIQSGNALGIEATLWSEYVPDLKKADIMTFPRVFPICEIGWHGSSSWLSVSQRLNFYYSLLDKCGYRYAKIHKANPSRPRAFFSRLWFEKRQLTWEGITNIIDDKKIEKIAKKLPE